MNYCIYCGDIAETKDHVIPYSFIGKVDRKKNRSPYTNSIGETVDSCLECNMLLSNKMLITVKDRTKYLFEKVKRRYRTLIVSKDWNQDELDELGYGLKTSVLERIAQKDRIVQRLESLGRFQKT